MTYEIMQMIISLAAALITAFLVPYIKGKIGEAKWQTIVSWIKVAVQAAEKMFEDQPASGQSKKQYVLEFLAAKGIVLTEAELDALIESAVLELDKALE